MADRGRDLKVSILSDASKFDVSEPADDLERLGSEAQDTGREMARVGDDARSAGSDLDRLGRDAKDAAGDVKQLETDAKDVGDGLEKMSKEADDAAEKVERSFKQIADASRTNLRQKVDDDSGAAKESLGEIGAEAQDTGREMAASFSGSKDDVIDAFQELSANALTILGPVGIGVGIAAASAIGFVRANAEKVKEEVQGLVETFFDLGGALDNAAIADRIREMAVAGELKDLRNEADKLGVSFRDLARAQAGDAEANKRVLDAIRPRLEKMRELQRTYPEITSAQQSELIMLEKAYSSYQQNATVVGLAEEALSDYTDATGKSVAEMQRQAELAEDLTGALDGVATSADDVAEATEIAARREAEANGEKEDAWSQYADTVELSVDDILAAQEKQLRAQADFEKNTSRVYSTLGQEAVQWALDQGENAARAMQMLADAPQDKASKIVANYKKLGARSGEALVQGLAQQERSMSAWGARLGGAAASAAQREIDRRGPVRIRLAYTQPSGPIYRQGSRYLS